MDGHTADAAGLAQAQHQYEDGALELALGCDGSDPVRLRKAIALFGQALGFQSPVDYENQLS